jgi:hypothetical protein
VQQLDHACTAIAETNIALQLLGAVWRLLGQLVAVEALTFVMLRPKVLVQLHQVLSTKAVAFSNAMHKLGLTSSGLSEGGLLLALWVAGWRGSGCLLLSVPRASRNHLEHRS